MRSNYKRLGDYIRQVDVRNVDAKEENLLGVSTQKFFIPSIANTVGTDFSRYKVVKHRQFTYVPDTSRRGDRIGIALLQDYDEGLVSNVYTVFEIIDTTELLPEYLMLWFMRPEFDRYARFMSHGSVREIFGWDEMCDVTLPVPDTKVQQQIVDEYNTVKKRINLNERLIKTLEETAQAVYKQWFVDFDFPDENGNPYKTSGGKMIDSELGEIPEGWSIGTLGEVAKLKSGFAFKSECWTSSGIPVIKIGSIQKNTIHDGLLEYVKDVQMKTIQNYSAQSGDIVIAMTGATVGKIALIPHRFEFCLVNQRVGIFDLGKKPMLKAAFLFTALQQDFVQNAISTIGGDSAQANISGENIQSIKISISNQLLVESKYNELLAGVIHQIIILNDENEICLKACNLLLSKLSTVEG